MIDQLPTQACRHVVVGEPKLVERPASLGRKRFQLVELCQCGWGEEAIGAGRLCQRRLQRHE